MLYVNTHGAAIPALGFGTFELDGDTCHHMVSEALEIGYRHIDTAQAYRNERAVGSALQESDVSRDDVFITTKIWPDNYRDGDLQRSVERCLERLAVDAVDLLLLHWPSPDVPLEETMGALNAVKAAGRTRHIGISNFTSTQIDEAVRLSDAPLVTNQVEYHPYLDQRPVLEALRRHDMSLTAYAPLAQGQVIGDDTLAEIGRSHGKSAGQVTLRWLLQQPGVMAIPRTSSPEHLKTNFDVMDFELDDEQMSRISALHRPDGRIINPAGLAPDWD